MKVTGIIRKVDTLGRIVIPSEVRKLMNIKESDPIEILLDDGNIILRKYSISCAFCGSEEGIMKFNNITICMKCRKKIANNIDLVEQ